MFGKTWVALLVLTMLAAPVIAMGSPSAPPVVGEAVGGAEAEADHLIGVASDQLGDVLPPEEESPGSPSEDPPGRGGPSDDPPQGDERGAPGDDVQEQLAAAVAAARAEADAAAAEAEAQVAGGIGLVEGRVVKPVQEAAEGIQAEVDQMLEPEAPAEEPEPVPAAEAAATGFELSTPLLLAGAAAATAGGVFAFWLAGSSSGVAATSELRRVLPGASPLFTRFEKDTVLGHPKRERLYASIMERPGITLQDLCDEANLSRTAVTHHLRLLEQQHLVVSKRMGRSRHYFENGGRYGRDQKEAYAVLQNDRSREIAEFVQGHPGVIQKRICEALGIQASVAHWHMRRLQEAELVEPVRQGRTVSYFPTGRTAS